MLNIASAETLVHDHQQALHADAARARAGRMLRAGRRGRRLRTRAGRLLVRAGEHWVAETPDAIARDRPIAI